MRSLRAAALPAVFLVLSSPLPAADPDFNAIVEGIESHYGVKRLHIPLLGVVNFFVKVTRPQGVKQLNLAVFEDLNYPPADGSQFDALVRNAVGGRWEPLVVARSRRDNEWTYIYSSATKHDWKLLVATFEPSEATVVQLKVNPAKLARMLAEPEHMGRSLGTKDSR